MRQLPRRDLLGLATGACALAALPGTAWAQVAVDNLLVYVGIAPGGVSDTAARTVAAQPNAYARNIIVENRTGAGGQLAVTALRGKPADGRTCMVTPASVLTIYPHTYRQLPYDPFRDLVPVAMAGKFEFGFGVGPMVPASVTTMAQFFDWCRKNPAQASFASPAAGSIPHFVGILAARHGGVEIVHVPYRGMQPAVLDMIGGQIAAASGPVGGFVEHVKAGKCRLLATSGSKRSRFTPGVPTYAEQGIPEIQFDEWLGFFMPSGTPRALAESASESIRAAIVHPDAARALATAGVEAESSTPAELAQLLRRDHDRWQPIVKSVGFIASS